ncbi:MAG: NADH-quinone oxidoreductase subunit M [Gammaproteobacteria bacterium]|nr:NADH-quinone oxidoreductase subunit M [Gammaproteobacteria bacterium]
MPYLSLVIWVPVLGGIVVLAADRLRVRWLDIRWLALGFSILTFALSIPLYTSFDVTTPTMQFVEKVPWIAAYDVNYYLGVDGISMPLIILTSFMTVIVIIACWKIIQYKLAQYLAAFLIMAGLMNGTFASLNAVLFYLFWEAMLIPMFLIIGIWGGPRRIYAALKFFLYTFLGSVLMLVVFIWLYLKTGSFDILGFYNLHLGLVPQMLIFFGLFAAFAVKVPMVPVHTWLPDAHVEAPTGGSVILAAILLKMGAYGFLRFNLPIAPDASMKLEWFMIALSLIAIIYIGLVAMMQKDMKKLVAYSSIAHMGFVTLGFFVIFMIWQNTGSLGAATLTVEGSLVQMISHGLISGGLFLCVGVLYDRMHTHEMAQFGGVVKPMPKYGYFFLAFMMANSGLPLTSGFVGEFMVILGSFQANFWVSVLTAVALITACSYSLYLIKQVVFGKVKSDRVAALKDISPREVLILALVFLPVLLIGFYPQIILRVMHPTVTHLLSQVVPAALGGGAG